MLITTVDYDGLLSELEYFKRVLLELCERGGLRVKVFRGDLFKVGFKTARFVLKDVLEERFNSI